MVQLCRRGRAELIKKYRLDWVYSLINKKISIVTDRGL